MWRGVWILFGCLLPVVAQALSCSVCGREIHGQYLRAEGKILCSAECWEKLLPRCSLCGAPLSGRYVKFEPVLICYSDGHVFFYGQIHRGENPHVHKFRYQPKRLYVYRLSKIPYYNRRFYLDYFFLSVCRGWGLG